MYVKISMCAGSSSFAMGVRNPDQVSYEGESGFLEIPMVFDTINATWKNEGDRLEATEGGGSQVNVRRWEQGWAKENEEWHLAWVQHCHCKKIKHRLRSGVLRLHDLGTHLHCDRSFRRTWS